ncbi:MAG: aminotransferase class V-fold PLP-dependent enzyme [Pseudomonadota bacterium]
MLEANPTLFAEIRNRFAHVDTCPLSGTRIFFENAGGALTLKSAVETSAFYAGIPDNQGRDNATAHALVATITKAKADAALLFGASTGQVFVGESGTELLFRLIRNAIAAGGGDVAGSTVEHPASRSAAQHWAEKLGRRYISIGHDDALGLVTPEAYAAAVTEETCVATILHTSPVTGMAMDVGGIAAAIRAKAPGAFIIVDGIQHACHGAIDIDGYDIDGYVVSPYKVFSRHGYGVAWVSDRLTAAPHEALIGGPPQNWELGTRDTGAYATFSDVTDYFEWLGTQVSDTDEPRARMEAASHAIKAQEKALTDAAIQGLGNLAGLADLPGVHILGGPDNPAREGLVSFWVDGMDAADIVAALNAQGIRTHVRKADHYSGNILNPLGQASCVRVSFCHYNSTEEVRALLTAMQGIVPG